VASRFRGELGVIVGWLVFPLVPVILADIYYQICTNPFSSARFGPDPLDWDWTMWVVMLGPLVGYGFLAGATVDLPDEFDASRRGWRSLLARRSLWVAAGPWCGFVALGLGFVVMTFLENQLPALKVISLPQSWQGSWVETAFNWFFGILLVATLAYGWLWFVWFALRRASSIGRFNRALYRGLAVALAFVGSLFGSFWATTSWWRSYFFDTRFPLLIAAIVLTMTSGCDSPITYGELRRRELFHAMMVAWVLGLALMWRWWSRRRPRPPSGAGHEPT
jgi:MFS family permease